MRLEELFAETARAGRKVDLRPIKPGVAHLVAPARCHKRPADALVWLEQVLGLGGPLSAEEPSPAAPRPAATRSRRPGRR